MILHKLTALLTALLLLGGCGAQENEQTSDPAPETPTQQEQQAEAPQTEPQPEPEKEQQPEAEPEPENIILRLTAVGDNLLHNTISFDSRLDGGYDFMPVYQGIAHKIEGSDLAIVNQEVPLDGTVGSYPTLSAPVEAADALKAVGFHVATLANNHMADKGAAGLQATIEALEARGIHTVGAHAADMPGYIMVEKQGIRIGILSYTYGTNSGLGDKNWTIDRMDTDKIRADVEVVRPQCDFLIAAMHWGEEYQKAPSKGQQAMAQTLADLGIDLIIGSHPHVMQPAAWLTGSTGNETLCVYSLGNFISDQREQDRMIGALLTCELIFAPDGSFLGYQTAELDGVITHCTWGSKNFALYMLEDYTEALAAEHGLHKHQKPISLAFFQERMMGMKESIKR